LAAFADLVRQTYREHAQQLQHSGHPMLDFLGRCLAAKKESHAGNADMAMRVAAVDYLL
jgi:TPP-dependent pyruvate/acetoin dehydrogenase alpha subunit